MTPRSRFAAEVQPGVARTVGLSELGHKELQLTFERGLEESALAFLEELWEYITGGRLIAPGETVSRGYWVVRFLDGDDRLVVAEFDDGWSAFVPGATRALRFWEVQQAECRALGSDFDPPLADRLAAVSAGVLEGHPVEGVRYRAPSPMSGWYLTTSLYDGDIESLSTLPLYRVTAERPELARYLALEPGHYFDRSVSDRAGFDAEIAAE